MKTIISLFRIFESNVDGHQQKSYLCFFLIQNRQKQNANQYIDKILNILRNKINCFCVFLLYITMVMISFLKTILIMYVLFMFIITLWFIFNLSILYVSYSCINENNINISDAIICCKFYNHSEKYLFLLQCVDKLSLTNIFFYWFECTLTLLSMPSNLQIAVVWI